MEKIILGIDPGTNVMGFGLIKAEGRQLSVLEIGVIELQKLQDPYTKLQKIYKTLTSIVEKYAPDESGSFLGGMQGADFFAEICGIASEKTAERIKEKYSRLKCFDTGIFGTFYACKTLFELGAADIAISMLGSHGENHSFGFMLDSGATTLWENWNGEASNNHPMFGACVSTFFENILGIKQSESSCGFEKIIISPAENNLLSFAKGYITTVKGKISVEYRKDGNETEFVIDLCGGADGELVYGGRSYPLHSGANSIKA